MMNISSATEAEDSITQLIFIFSQFISYYLINHVLTTAIFQIIIKNKTQFNFNLKFIERVCIFCRHNSEF